MKKKKGFTLIELLSVIVILAIIALIAVPIILNVIENSRKRAAVASALGYVRAVNYKIADEALFNRVVDEDEEYVIGENELDLKAENIDNITGAYILQDGRVFWAGLCVGKYSVEYNEGHAELTGDYCGIGTSTFVKPDAIALSEACKTDADTVYSNNNTFKIEKVNDLACLSNLASTGKNFSGKTIYLFNDIDITDNNSYADGDPTTTIYGDINGNGTVEGLKVELTTGAGFRPIGNDSTQFKGTFEGYAYTISNLMINRNSSYVGLFGYNAGTITGLRMRNVVISADSNIGSIAGVNSGTIKNVDVTGSISGTNGRVGGITGTVSGPLSDFIFSGSVTGGYNTGGAAGFNGIGNSTVVGVVLNTTVTSTAAGVGLATTYNTPKNVMVVNSTLVHEGGREWSYDGTPLNSLTIGTIDGTLDTYIGGDNDGDNYYFDYDSNGNIVLYNTETTKQSKKLKGRGTEQNPYIISNAADWRLATATIGTTAYHYILKNDIDFDNTRFYPLGTETNKFTGTLDGKHKKISNVSLNGYSNSGVIGYNTGTIENINFDNISIVNQLSVAGIVGNNAGTINGVRARNITISGDGSVGGLAGSNSGTIKNADIRANLTSTSNRAGGITGSHSGTISEFIFSGSVTGGYNTGGAIGYNGRGAIAGIVYNTTVTSTAGSVGLAATYNDPSSIMVVNSTLVHEGGREWSYDGVALNSLTIGAVDGIVDTYIGGDNDGDNYYFDYDSTGVLVLYSTEEKEIINTLAGAGTEQNPYIIGSADEWNIATSTIGSTPKYYELSDDIDFTGKNFYPMGTNANKFNGTLNGNNYTVSNVNMYGHSYAGIIGYNNGTLKNINFNNIAISNKSKYSGITGYNAGTINGVKARNLSVTANDTYTGGITGHNSGTGIIKNVDVRGTITGVGCTGGIAGQMNGTLSDFVFKGTVSGGNTTAGAVGKNETGYWTTIEGVVYDTTVSCTGSFCAKAASYNGPKNVKVYNTSIIYDGGREWAYDGTEIAEKTLEVVDDAIDTTIDGDSDGDGYYFTLVNGEYELITAS